MPGILFDNLVNLYCIQSLSSRCRILLDVNYLTNTKHCRGGALRGLATWLSVYDLFESNLTKCYFLLWAHYERDAWKWWGPFIHSRVFTMVVVDIVCQPWKPDYSLSSDVFWKLLNILARILYRNSIWDLLSFWPIANRWRIWSRTTDIVHRFTQFQLSMLFSQWTCFVCSNLSGSMFYQVRHSKLAIRKHGRFKTSHGILVIASIGVFSLHTEIVFISTTARQSVSAVRIDA